MDHPTQPWNKMRSRPRPPAGSSNTSIAIGTQNIDLMNLAGFCRNCLSRWYREAAEAAGAPWKTALHGSGCTACPMRRKRTSKGRPFTGD